LTGTVQAATIRRRIGIPLRFGDGYSTNATVISFTGLADGQQHVAFELGRPACAELPTPPTWPPRPGAAGMTWCSSL
jgi:GTP cyclohydrolase II